MIELKNISKAFSGKEVLKDISIGFPQGSFTIIIGENGSGKSTLLNIITGIIKADSGSIFYNSKILSDEDVTLEFKRILGYSSQSNFLIDDFSVFEFLQFICLLYNADKRNIDEVIKIFFEKNADEILKTKIGILSHGQKRKISICSLLIHNPAILVFDEPFSDLDSRGTIALIKILEQAIENGKTIIMVAHHFDNLIEYPLRFISIQNKTAQLIPALNVTVKGM